MNHKKNSLLLAVVAASTLALVGCKKDAGAKEIELPEGQTHLGAQWAGNQLWVESFDAKTSTCTFAQYQDGKVVEDSVITFKNCRAGGGSPMMRPMMPNMPNRQGMMQNGRPAMPGKSGMPMMPGKPGPQIPAQPGADGAPATAVPAPEPDPAP